MSKHTPGPWFTADHDDFVVAAGDGFSICDCAPGNPYDVTDAQGLANAKLIATAPELKDALEQLERAVSAHFARVIGAAVPPELRDIDDQVMKARCVISKAGD